MSIFPLQTKRSFTLLEVLLSSIIGAILLYSGYSILFHLTQKEDFTYHQTITKLDFETTRHFLEYKIKNDSTLNSLQIRDQIVSYNNAPLIKNVTHFTKQIEQMGITIDICTDLNGEFCTQIYIKKETL